MGSGHRDAFAALAQPGGKQGLPSRGEKPDLREQSLPHPTSTYLNFPPHFSPCRTGSDLGVSGCGAERSAL